MTKIAMTAMCLALVLNMAGYLSVAGIVPLLLVEWQLTEIEVALLASCHIGVYAVAALILLPLCDRWDTKTVILWSLFCAAIGGFGFAWFADDLWSGIAFRALVGIAQAGVSMPGLKLIADNLEGRARSKATALYSSMIPVGSGLSLLLPTLLPDVDGWRPVFEVTGMAGLVGWVMIAALVPRTPRLRRPSVGARNPYVFHHVYQNAAAMRVIWSYAGHVWETFGYRSWIVAFLVFAAASSFPIEAWTPDMAVFAAFVVVAAAPASIILGHWSVTRDRMSVLRWVSRASLIAAVLLAAFADANLYAVMALAAVYGIVGFADHGALGSAIVDAAEPEHRGATLAIYTFLGFGFGMLGAVACGAALQLAGGVYSASAWPLLWLTCGLGSVAVTLLLRQRRQSRPAAGTRSGHACVSETHQRHTSRQRQIGHIRMRDGW